MLMILMYHHVGQGPHANRLDMLREHLRHLSDWPVLLPGETLPKGLSLSLVFDDAYFDFYHQVFPLLQEFGLRATLAVPVGYILESCDLPAEERLRIIADDPYGNYELGPFCTWGELSELASHGVEIASHSLNHVDLTAEGVDLNAEIVDSKRILEQKLQREVQTFVYPYGKMNRKVHDFTKAHYRYAMRIGFALNKDWTNRDRLLYRVSGDALPSKDFPLTRSNLRRYRLKYFANSLRGK
jgi:peptidoglycan/xylan/chitin deacetylase (PgdA/CDA1 family)